MPPRSTRHSNPTRCGPQRSAGSIPHAKRKLLRRELCEHFHSTSTRRYYTDARLPHHLRALVRRMRHAYFRSDPRVLCSVHTLLEPGAALPWSAAQHSEHPTLLITFGPTRPLVFQSLPGAAHRPRMRWGIGKGSVTVLPAGTRALWQHCLPPWPRRSDEKPQRTTLVALSVAHEIVPPEPQPQEQWTLPAATTSKTPARSA